MVYKLMQDADIAKVIDHPMLMGKRRYICVVPACTSAPCQNRGSCMETETGYECMCTTDYYGPQCSCPLIYTPDGGSPLRYFLFPGIDLTGSTSRVEFEVSANHDAHLALSGINAAERFMYRLVFGAGGNTIFFVQRDCSSAIGDDFACSTAASTTAIEAKLTTMPAYDHFWVTFNGGCIEVGRYGNSVPFMKWTDPNPLPIQFAGVWTGWGSDGYWKFKSLC
ncbi:C3 and PZP-like alpha-2-macroglobulin domain-containing protein 8 isoform X2 [Diadema setosum]